MKPNEQNKLPQPDRLPAQDNIFVIKPEPKKPVDKKSIWLTVALTAIGIVILVLVLVVALINSADNLASDYRTLARVQVTKLDVPLKDLEPSTVLNNRNIEKALAKISLSQRSQPSLENVLFIGQWSQRYLETEKLQAKIQQHYKNLNQYSSNLDQLLVFDNGIEIIRQQEPALVVRENMADSLSIRSIGGSYSNFSQQIKNIDTPPQLKNLQKKLAKIYSDKANIYLNWAKSIEAGDNTRTDVSKQQLATLEGLIPSLVTDKNYSQLFTTSYKKILVTHTELKTALAN